MIFRKNRKFRKFFGGAADALQESRVIFVKNPQFRPLGPLRPRPPPSFSPVSGKTAGVRQKIKNFRSEYGKMVLNSVDILERL